MPVLITARREGFRRLGIAHSAKTTTYPDDRFTPAQLVVLESDPNLIVMRVDNASQDDAAASLAQAQTRIAELEAGMEQLGRDAGELKEQLAQAGNTIAALTEERDALQAKLSAVASNEPAEAQEADKPATNGRKKS
ncbi:TPA: HI1506-related protein [Citrobacter koseri]